MTAVNHTNYDNPLSLTVAPKSDIVGLPFNPMVKPWQFASPMSKVSLSAGSFKRARATFAWPNMSNIECDQIGLLLVRPLSPLPMPDFENPGDIISAPYYIKFGLEVINSSPVIAVAGSNHLLDWSTWPTTQEDLESLTIEFMRYGTGLLARIVRYVGEAKEEQSENIRLLTWPFANTCETSPDMWIGIYLSRPDTNDTTEAGFSVTFDRFEVETLQGAQLSLG